ncbi:ABC transporter ATP-binding protein [Vibrio harveyi]|uniref:ABC transporter ATP-binding protein n=1 Tax=Vibrio harveyi TaxID=669 RepID=UPI00211A5351|nr:ABC transporter ATP-binding protein [Vibrio harveyi]MCQ9084232.1 ABC transporter ATP-binding protein [Vibrio harveyi]
MHLTDKMSVTQALISLLKTEKKRITYTGVSAVLCVFAELVTWICLYAALSKYLNTQSLYFYLALMTIAVCVRYFFYTISVWQAHLAAYQIIQTIRQKLVRALSEMPTAKLMQYHRGDIEKRLSDDCQSLEPLIAHHTTDIITGTLLPFVLLGFMVSIDWQLGLIALSPLPLAVIAQTVMMRGFSDRQKKYNQVVANMHKAQLEFLRSIGVMKLFGVDADSYRQLSNNMTKHHKLVNAYTNQMVGAWVTFTTLAQASLVLVIPFAIVKLTQGSLSPAELAMIVILCAGILKPWLDLTQIFGQVQQSFSSLERILPLFSATSDQHFKSIATPYVELCCENLAVKRDSLDIVSGLNLQLSHGECIVIQGASGSGKSSLLATLYGELATYEGDWFINQKAVSSMSDRERSQFISVVDQHPVFFSASIRENLVLGDRLIHDSVIIKLLDMLGLSALIEQLPNGLYSSMDETERNFSGGELQRLAIARAMLVRPAILVLDEATSHLDKVTENRVLEAIRQHAPQQIQLVISHGSQALTIANRAFSLSHGQLKQIHLEETVCA